MRYTSGLSQGPLSAKCGPCRITVSSLWSGINMLSKTQANQIAEGLFAGASKSRRDYFEPVIDIQRPRSSFAVIGVLPLALGPLLHAKGEDLALILAVYLGCIAIVLARCMHWLYMRRTPLVRINETSLTFFGNSQKQQKVFQRAAISSIRLSLRPNFWRSSYRFIIVAHGETVVFWIYLSAGGCIQELGKALRAQFPKQFEARVS